jgi:ABC-type transporter Mla subunit MlaD
LLLRKTILSNDSSSKTDPLIHLRQLMMDASTANQTARQQLERAGQDLWELNQVLDRLGRVSASLQPIAQRLSEMTLDTARRVWGAGSAGEPFLALVAQLSELAGHTGLAVGDLDNYLRRATQMLQAAVSDAKKSSAELERILPALKEANRTPPPLPEQKIVALELKITSSEDRSGGQPRPPSILDAWPERQGRQDLKN